MKSVLLLSLIVLFTACSDKFGSQAGPTGPGPIEPAPSRNGNEQGNGTDNLPYEAGSAWFYEDNVIQYCYVKSPTFPVGNAQIEADLAAAFKTWADYIQAKDINHVIQERYVQSVISNIPDEPARSQRKEYAERMKLHFTLTKKSALRPQCDEYADVKFYFGATSPEVNEGLKKYYDPTAFAKRTAFGSKSGWSKGFVWLSEHLKNRGLGEIEWNLPFRLRGILIHEIGHIYGCDHTDRTIMAADLASNAGSSQVTTQPQREIEYLLTHIDNQRELFLPPLVNSQYNYEGTGSLNLRFDEIFATFLGRKPVGFVSTRFKNSVLEFTDATGTFRVPVDIEPESIISNSSGSVFKTSRTWTIEPPNSDFGATQDLFSENQSYIASAKDIQGQKVSIQITRNFGYTPLMLFYFLDGKRKSLFYQNTPFVF